MYPSLLSLIFIVLTSQNNNDKFVSARTFALKKTTLYTLINRRTIESPSNPFSNLLFAFIAARYESTASKIIPSSSFIPNNFKSAVDELCSFL